jgi:alkanesulfonate monooxygenase SsuD/methylene tetrahydromethanopterin reductase-like flavin-dependent oxidoreductase (luciferase family)
MEIGLDLPAHWPDTGHHIDNLFPELIEAAKFGDQIGFDSFCFAEHHFNDYFVQPAPFALASYVAAITKVPRFIVSVVVLPLHDVRRVAGEIAMTDHLTNGRLEVGFGRGGAQYEFDCFDMPYSKSREIFEDRLKGLLVLFSGKDVSYEGPYTRFPTLTIMPPPLQKPHPPFWMAVIRPEAAYHCARNGYHCQAAALRRDRSIMKEVMAAFRQGAAEAGPRKKPIQISVHQWIYVANDEADVQEKLRMAYANQQRFMNHYTTPGTIIGGITQPIEITDTLDSLRDALIIGTPDFCIERLLALKEAGYDHLILRTHFGPAHEDVMGSLDRFAEHVKPYLGLSSRTRERARVQA